MDEVNTCLLLTGTFSIDWKLYLNVASLLLFLNVSLTHTLECFPVYNADTSYHGFPIKYHVPYSTAW